MTLQKLLFVAIFFVCLAVAGFSQTPSKTKTDSTASSANSQALKATPAYAELLLRRTELESDVESWLETYTEEYPKLKAARFELDLINKDLTKLLAQTDASRLTLALGKLLVRKNQIETDLWVLENQYGKDYPEVKRNRRKLESFQKSIKEILP